jgi:hypothetical protein
MAHARQADRAYPQFTINPIVAAVAAVLVTGIIAFAAVDPLGLQRPSVGAPGSVNPAVLEAGRQWELERKAQGGYIDPVLESGRDWELQRKQQSVDYE